MAIFSPQQGPIKQRKNIYIKKKLSLSLSFFFYLIISTSDIYLIQDVYETKHWNQGCVSSFQHCIKVIKVDSTLMNVHVMTLAIDMSFIDCFWTMSTQTVHVKWILPSRLLLMCYLILLHLLTSKLFTVSFSYFHLQTKGFMYWCQFAGDGQKLALDSDKMKISNILQVVNKHAKKLEEIEQAKSW